MRLLMAFGGLIGFSIGLSMGWAQDCPPQIMLLRASVAAFLAGVVLRWWGRVWVKSYQQAQQQKLASTVQSQDKSPL